MGLSEPNDRDMRIRDERPSTASQAPNVRMIRMFRISVFTDVLIDNVIIITIFKVDTSKKRREFSRLVYDKHTPRAGIMMRAIKNELI